MPWTSRQYERKGIRLYNDGKYQEAFDMMQKGRVLFPTDTGLLVGEGMCRVKLGDYALARDLLVEARKTSPKNLDVLHGLIDCFLNLGKPNDALDAGWAVADATVNDASSLVSAAYKFLHHNRPELAYELLCCAVSVDTELMQAHLGLAEACRALEKTKPAFALLKNIVRRDPEAFPAWNILGIMHFEAGDKEAALDCWSRVSIANHYDTASMGRYIGLLERRLSPANRYLQRLREELKRMNRCKTSDVQAIMGRRRRGMKSDGGKT